MHEYVTRQQWGAAPPTAITRIDPASQLGIVAHHSAGPDTQTPLQIQAFHQNVRSWRDVAYSFLIDIHGTVYEGRGHDVQQAAHNPVNRTYLSVCFIANLEIQPLPQEAKDSFRILRRSLMALGVGEEVRIHSEFSATACPGKAARQALSELKSEPDLWAGSSMFNLLEL